MCRAWTILLVVAAAAPASAEPIRDDLLTTPGVAFETYLARWWGAPGSEMTRPIYRIARFDTDAVQVHYGIVPGRELADYTMPYWPVRSFLSFVDAPMELAQQVKVTYRDVGGTHAKGFAPRSGVELAPQGNALAVKIRNRSLAAPEDVTIAGSSSPSETLPLSLEQTLVLRKGEPVVPVLVAVSNASNAALKDVAVSLTFEQSFGWSHFGVAEQDVFTSVQAPHTGAGRAFYAFSEGMGRGYVLSVGEGSRLAYEVKEEMNTWRVTISWAADTLAPSATETLAYSVRVIRAVPEQLEPSTVPPGLREREYTRVQPTSFRTAPVEPAERVAIQDVLERLDKPKVRGLNLRAGFPQAFDDLEVLKDWGCNLIIVGIGGKDAAAFIERGHALGMEMLVAGHGSYHDGPPRFDGYYKTPRTAEQLPDGHGQDEDHYYWYAIQPTEDFPKRFNKPMASASHDERVAYWGNCFVDKWQGVREAVRPHAPDAGVWFYAPFPGVAHVDPVDSYDLFMRTLAEGLGDKLTVFPFYYGIEYNQCEYMMRCWKDCGAKRAVFLPMRDFMTKPSQFMRAITAARRGGADGSCGFSFPVGDAPTEKQWQWKAVMLGAWADFPTPELNAYCLIEEPARLVEALAESDMSARLDDKAKDFDGSGYLAPLLRAGPSKDGALDIVVTDTSDRPAAIPEALWKARKGFLRMEGGTVRVSGADAQALRKACDLLLRFADVARDEAVQ